ncbi:MAG: shikimate dehydrogenase [Xylanivirga thermophila]|jgi:shikimate dehydrogenase|uniref:shikimate dehydrogenase n=1 Tax=Xylanivirga thermophila TaxID=2496273 RepID=UPI00101C3E8E|nr:shikimate dehydrogenase [Xylanivirga thermophila]
MLGLIGHPVEHSLSPKLHNTIYKKLRLEITYSAYDIFPENLEKSIIALKEQSFLGFNVTIPYKQKIIEYLDYIDEEAKIIGAVNTVKIKNGKMIGYNTDGMGFIESLHRKGIKIENKTALVIGAGGASRAICTYLLREGVSNLYIANRTPSKVYAIIMDLKNICTHNIIEYMPFSKLNSIGNIDIVVNATSIGMWPQINDNPIPDYKFRPNTVCFDAVYNPLKTKFLEAAENESCIIINGIDMLIFQALKSIEIWLETPIPNDIFSYAKSVIFVDK